MRLAREIVTLYHGENAANDAELQFQKVFSEGGIPEDMPQAKVEKGTLLVDLIATQGLAPSKSEAKRLIQQNAVKLNERPITSIDAPAEEGILKVGKRKFLKISL
jgi:tyrosyl-tRNA synthetase